MLSLENRLVDGLIDSGCESLKRDGFVLYENLIAEEFIAPLKDAYLKRIEAPVSYGGKVGRSVDYPNAAYADFPLTLHKNAVEFALSRFILDILEAYAETELMVSYAVAYRTKLLPERQATNFQTPGVFQGWHSDANLIAPDRGYRMLVAMLYLNDVKPGGGGMQVIRGSHLYGSEKRAWLPAEIEERRDDIVEICAPAGSVTLFDMEIIHRAGTPTEQHRDIFRCMYAPRGGYGEALVFANDTLPPEIDADVARRLRLAERSPDPIKLSDGIPYELLDTQALWTAIKGKVWFETKQKIPFKSVVKRLLRLGKI